MEIGGLFYLHAGAAAVPLIALNEHDLCGNMVTVPLRSMRDRCNGMRCVFVNPDNNWQPGDAAPMRVAAYVTEDNGVELYQDMRLPFTISGRAARRLMKIEIERIRRQREVVFPAKLSAMNLRPLDTCYLSFDLYGWANEEVLVTGWSFSDEQGIELTLRAHDAAIYDWIASEELDLGVSPATTLPDASSMAAPSDVPVTTPVTLLFTTIAISWAAVLSIWLDGYDVEFRDAGASDWTSYGRVGGGATRIASVERSTPQEFRVRAVSVNGAAGAFTENLTLATPGGVTATGGTLKIDVAWTNATGAIDVQIFSAATNAPETATLLATVAGVAAAYANTGLGAAETRFYWLRSVNSTGNFSAITAVVSATTL